MQTTRYLVRAPVLVQAGLSGLFDHYWHDLGAAWDAPQQVPNLTHVFWACAGPRARSDCIVATPALSLTTFL